MSTAAFAGTPTEEQSPLRRALDMLPHSIAEDAERRLVDAAAHYELTRDDSRLLEVIFQILGTARLEASHDFRLAMKQSEAEWDEDGVEPIHDHRAYIQRLRA